MKANRSRTRILATGALCALATGLVSAEDIRIVNANIITMDDENPTARTMLIRDNRIVSVGNQGRGSGDYDSGPVRVINARGKLVIPAIHDQHLHWVRSAITWGHAVHEGETAYSLEALEDAIRERTQEVPAGEWITLIGRHTYLQFLEDPSDPLSGRYPTIDELDDWAPDHPVLMLHRWLPDPIGAGPLDYNRHASPGPGQVNSSARDFFNNLTPAERMPNVDPIPVDGTLAERPGNLAEQVYVWTRAHNSIENQKRSILDLQRWSHGLGLVTIGNAGGLGFRQPQDYTAVLELDREDKLRMRLRYQLTPGSSPGAGTQSPLDRLRNVLGGAPRAEIMNCIGPPELPGEGFHMSRIGSPFFQHMGLGEFFTAPTPNDVAEAVVLILRRPDWSFQQHAEQGQIANIISGLQMGVAMNDPCQVGTLADRHASLDHLNDATAVDLINLAQLGVGANIQAVRFLFPDWEYSGPPFRLAVDIAKDYGLHVGFGADGMFAGHGNPWTTMEFMVTGKNFNGEDLLTNDPLGRGPQQITLMEALRGHTVDNAWFTREEHERGQLKPGFLADVVMLNQNPFEVPADQISETEAALTIVDGEVVYESKSPDRRRNRDRHGRRSWDD
jgi:cytosine/adenosine deaminase-related metal-dependent hydrolase